MKRYLAAIVLALAVPHGGGRRTFSERCTVVDPATGIMWTARPDQISEIMTIWGFPVIHIAYRDDANPWEYDVSVANGIVECERCLCWPSELP